MDGGIPHGEVLYCRSYLAIEVHEEVKLNSELFSLVIFYLRVNSRHAANWGDFFLVSSLTKHFKEGDPGEFLTG